MINATIQTTAQYAGNVSPAAAAVSAAAQGNLAQNANASNTATQVTGGIFSQLLAADAAAQAGVITTLGSADQETTLDALVDTATSLLENPLATLLNEATAATTTESTLLTGEGADFALGAVATGQTAALAASELQETTADTTFTSGLLGTRETTSSDSLQSILARIPNQATPQEKAADQALLAANSHQDALVGQLKAGSSVATEAVATLAQPAAPKENPLLALSRKTLVSNQPTATQQHTKETAKDAQGDDALLAASGKSSLLNFSDSQHLETIADGAEAGIKPDATSITQPNTPVSATPLSSLSPQAQELAAARSLPSPTEQVSLKIAQAVGTNDSKIDIQLEPVNLGKIQVHIDMSNGKTVISVHAEKAETLDMLRNDAKGLEKSLADAGIKADSGAMQFSHKQQGSSAFAFQQQNEFGGRGYGQNSYFGRGGYEGSASAGAAASAPLYRVYENNQALDIYA